MRLSIWTECELGQKGFEELFELAFKLSLKTFAWILILFSSDFIRTPESFSF